MAARFLRSLGLFLIEKIYSTLLLLQQSTLLKKEIYNSEYQQNILLQYKVETSTLRRGRRCGRRRKVYRRRRRGRGMLVRTHTFTTNYPLLPSLADQTNCLACLGGKNGTY